MQSSPQPPTVPATGMLFYDTVKGTVQVYDGSQWLELTNEIIVTADILWSAVLQVEAEHEKAEREEAEREEAEREEAERACG